ncbi:MAG TPA: CDP-glycerol glycerophosphotransferase family protein [Galbitalea sp.]|jgi:hypothetical protein
MIRRIFLAAAALAAAIATMTHWTVLMLAVVLYSIPFLLGLRRKVVRRTGDADQTGAAIVISVATGIVVLHADKDTWSIWEVAILLGLLHALHLLRHVLRVLVSRRWRTAADWRNIRVAAATPVRVEPVAGPTLVPILVWVLAPIFSIFDFDPAVFVLLSILSLALSIVTFVPTTRALLRNLRMPSESARLGSLTAAMREAGPELLVHFNARSRSAYALTDWITVLERVNERHRVVILTVDRQPWHFETIPATTIPLVHLSGAEAIEHFVEQVPSLAIALYPRNTSPNKNLLRVPGLFDVYIGHGDSDKAEAANPATRAFDEIWLAGKAARERYLAANIGVREEQLRIPGRPQVSELLDLARSVQPGSKKTVVYAPTWEGYYAEDGYSSILTLGVSAISALIARNDVTVKYVPHPALGSLNRAFADASDAVAHRVRRAGGTVVVAGTLTERYAAIASADLLVTDVSSDLVDFLALDRPYIVLNAGGMSAATFRAATPSAAAGTVLDATSIATLGDVVADSIDSDSRSADRAELAKLFLGDLSAPPLERFVAEVDRAVDKVRSSRPARELPAAEDQPA